MWKVFKKKQRVPEDCSETINSIEEDFYQNLITDLKTNPQDYSYKWFTGTLMDSSCKNRKRDILIFKDGTILSPIEIRFSPEKTKVIKELTDSIYRRDYNELLNKIFK